MATYRQNVTQTVEPAQANWQTAARAVEMQGETVVSALKGITELGKAYVDYDISKTRSQAEQVQSEFLISNMAAEQASKQ